MNKNSLIVTAKQKQRMIIALEANFGNVTKAAKIAGITPRTHQRWVKEDGDYEDEVGSIKDLGLKGMKDNLIDLAMKKAQQGNIAVLNKMLGIFLKDMPEEMKDLNQYNKIPFRVKVKVAPHPNDFFAKDPMTQLAVKRFMEDKEKEGKLSELRQDLVKKYKEGTIGEGESIG
jgi:hypothetical protein